MPAIPFTAATVTQCMCLACPVQTKSACVRQQTKEMRQALKSNPLDREKIPEVYCATGAAVCRDLDLKKDCLCQSCPIYAQHKLAGGKPTLYFCRDGAARSNNH